MMIISVVKEIAVIIDPLHETENQQFCLLSPKQIGRIDNNIESFPKATDVPRASKTAVIQKIIPTIQMLEKALLAQKFKEPSLIAAL